MPTGQYFSKSCVPGILSKHYNPYSTNPVNLCEACGTHGPKRCMRNDEEQYYGSSGAFRCVTEGLSLSLQCATRFYRAMHFSAKRGITIACRLSVRLSVRL